LATCFRFIVRALLLIGVGLDADRQAKLLIHRALERVTLGNLFTAVCGLSKLVEQTLPSSHPLSHHRPFPVANRASPRNPSQRRPAGAKPWPARQRFHTSSRNRLARATTVGLPASPLLPSFSIRTASWIEAMSRMTSGENSGQEGGIANFGSRVFQKGEHVREKFLRAVPLRKADIATWKAFFGVAIHPASPLVEPGSSAPRVFLV